MDLIDDKGHLFGIINIIDALVVLLVLSVVAAGTAFVLQKGAGASGGSTIQTNQNATPATRYATVNLGTHPSYVAERITEGDNSIVQDDNLTVTDVYQIPSNKNIRVWARVQLNGKSIKRENITEFAFGGKIIGSGSKLSVATDEYRINGTVHNVDIQNRNLSGGTTRVVLRTMTSTEIADAIQQNDTYVVANTTVATVESVEVYPTNDSRRKRVVLGVTLQTLSLNGQPEFLGQSVRIDQQLPFKTNAYAITGQVVHSGNTSRPGKRTTTTVTLKLSGVAPEIADGISTGMVERADGTARARITDKLVKPATIVVTSQNGTIHGREHPIRKDISLTVKLDARRTDSDLYFHGKQLQKGNYLVLNLGLITVRGQVVDLQRDE